MKLQEVGERLGPQYQRQRQMLVLSSSSNIEQVLWGGGRCKSAVDVFQEIIADLRINCLLNRTSEDEGGLATDLDRHEQQHSVPSTEASTPNANANTICLKQSMWADLTLHNDQMR